LLIQDSLDLKREQQGKYVVISTVGEKAEAFVPNPLPPNPAIEWTDSLRAQFDKAHAALGKLEGVSDFLPINMLLYSYVRKEAVLSSMIEGTQSSLSDLLVHEISPLQGVPLDDVTEVSNYVAAIEHGLKRLSEGFPISIRLIKDLHKILLSNSRGSTKLPGEIRNSQNWIGGTRPGNAVFVPPPPHLLTEGLSDLEKFIHDDKQEISTILKVGLVHHQFETLHPFLDGNGRVGRLLIILIFMSDGMLSEPLLYISLFLKTHRQRYYELLNNVRKEGDWESWLIFFAEAVEVSATSAVSSAKRLLDCAKADAAIIEQQGRSRINLARVHKLFQQRPISNSLSLKEATALAPATIQAVLKKLCDLNILSEITEKKRDRVYAYKAYIDILSEGVSAEGA
jgi:Fic family protein